MSAERFDARITVEFPPAAPDDVVEAIEGAIAELVFDWPRSDWDPFVSGSYFGARRARRAGGSGQPAPDRGHVSCDEFCTNHVG